MKTLASMAFALGMTVSGIPVSALAAEIGQVTVDGNKVILYDDKTWDYAEGETNVSAPADCVEIASKLLPISVCLDPDAWALGGLGEAYEHSFYNKANDMYVGLITEEDVIEFDVLKKAILTNAQNAAGLNKVETLEDSSASLSGHEFGKLEYRAISDGVDATFANFYTNFEGKGSLQIVAFAVSEEFDKVRPVIAEVIASVKVTD